MLEFFRSIGDALSTVFQLLINLVSGLLQFIGMLPQIFTFSTSVVGFIPTFLIVFFTSSIAITVILVMIHRKG